MIGARSPKIAIYRHEIISPNNVIDKIWNMKWTELCEKRNLSKTLNECRMCVWTNNGWATDWHSSSKYYARYAALLLLAIKIHFSSEICHWHIFFSPNFAYSFVHSVAQSTRHSHTIETSRERKKKLFNSTADVFSPTRSPSPRLLRSIFHPLSL